MRIVAIRESPVRLESNISNALVNFSAHTVSMVAVVSDRIRDGRPVTGLAFNSIGRFAQSGIINERMIPRLMGAAPESLLQECGTRFSPEKVLACIMRNEKPGGHGDRAQAASALELAIWDLNAKLGDEPVAATVARHYGRAACTPRVYVYAAGGYYYDGANDAGLAQELARYRELGFDRFKIKIGGAPLAVDLKRIESALGVAGSGGNLAVDANGRFSLDEARAYGRAMQGYGLMWFEEPGDPLDFELNRTLAAEYRGALATGENLFSHQDAGNLAAYGGLRAGLDIFQMDPGLSYGIVEYARMIAAMEARGHGRAQAYPHGGQLISLHVVAGLGLGGCEAYPGVFQPMGGFADGLAIEQGSVRIPDAPGFGFERKSNLINEFSRILQ